MRIVHLETGRHLYGGARQVLMLMQGLASRSIDGMLVCTAGSAVAQEAGRLGLPVQETAMGGDLDLGFVGRLATLLDEARPDLLHVHSRRGADWLGGLAAARVGLPAVLTRRVDRSEGPLARFKYRPYGRVVAISDAIYRQLEALGLQAPRLALVPSAVEPVPLAARWSRERLLDEFGLRPDAMVVGCVAQLIRRKGHVELLEAWQRVAADHPAARLLLFGRGPLEAELRARVQRLGLAGSVHFAGFRSDLHAFIGCLDLLVHPALREGLGLAVLEAAAAGVAVVAFRAGGLDEIIVDGQSGRLVPVGDAAALAAVLGGLLGDAGRRQVFGHAAREHVLQKHRPEAMSDAYLTLYGDLVETRQRHGSH